MNLKLLLILLIVLSFRFYFFYSNQHQFVDSQRISFETTLFSEPQVSGSRQSFTANYQNQKIRITTSRFPGLHYGDFVHISGPIRVLPRAGGFQPRAREGQPYGASTQQSKALIMNNIVLYFPKIEMVKSNSDLLDKSLKIVNNLRQKLIILFSKTLPAPSSSLLMGIIFGIKEQMPKDFSDN